MHRDWLNPDIIRTLGSIYTLLFGSLACGWYQLRIKNNPGILNFYNRAKSWFIITLIMTAVLVLQDYGLMVFFGALLLIGLFELECFQRGPRLSLTFLRTLLPVVVLMGAVYNPAFIAIFCLGFTLLLIALLFSARFSHYYAFLYKTNLLACWFISCIYVVHLALNINPQVSHIQSYKIVFFVMLTSQTNDILQYIMRKLYGRKLPFQIISPQKTREGYIYGLASSFVICPLLYGFLVAPLGLWATLVLTTITIGSGTLGDLIFSAIKRSQSKKDFSGLIPHHGGLLDRFDSLILALPLSYYSLAMLS
jgi:phosphatidate cytidylyltransferase